MDENLTPDINDDPYCKICNSCGEDDCCSATLCQMHEDGKYCKTHLQDLRFTYLMYQDLADKFIDDYPSEFNDIFVKNYDLIYEQNNDTTRTN